MNDRTSGGLILPDQGALELVKHAPWPQRGDGLPAKSKGIRLEAGYLSPYFITDPEQSTAELDDAFVLITGQTIVTPQELVPLLENVARTGRALLVIAAALGDEVLALLVLNKLRGILRVCAIADRNIETIAHYLGCVLLQAPLQRLAIKDLGAARHVRSGMTSTIIERME